MEGFTFPEKEKKDELSYYLKTHGKGHFRIYFGAKIISDPSIIVFNICIFHKIVRNFLGSSFKLVMDLLDV